VAVVLGTSAVRPGAEESNSFVILHLQGVGASNTTDYVNGTCNRETMTMKCHLISSFILPPKSESKIHAEIDEQLPYWQQDIKEKTRNQLCSYVRMTNNSQFLSEPEATITNQAFSTRVKQLLVRQNETTEAMCESPSEENAEKLMRARIDVENATCEVHSSIYDEVFTKQSNRVWVSNSGKPEGLCGSINIGRLTQNSKSNTDWTYEIRTINTKPDGSFCRGKTEYTERFSWSLNTGARECAWVVIY
jgi:hypothetical protein